MDSPTLKPVGSFCHIKGLAAVTAFPGLLYPSTYTSLSIQVPCDLLQASASPVGRCAAI